MSLLKCENLSFAYDGVTVVSNLNFSVEEGNYLCIIGENGAGKSTLIKGLLRLKKPSAGRVEMGEGLKATEIGYLPQQTQIQKDFPASVREVVLSGCLNRMGLRPFYSRVEKERAHEKMEALEILDLQDQCYRDLSGGQQQRVLLARAMCAAHKLILLDEPVSGLDPVATRSLYAQIARINETTGLTVIMVSHDIDASLRYASHILHLGQEGQLFFGTQKEYLRSAVYHEFLGDSAAPMWKHDFPNRLGNPAPREEAEPTETERQVRVQSGKKSSRRIRFGKTASAKTEEEEKTAKKASPAMSTAPEKTNGGAPATGAQKEAGAQNASGKAAEKEAGAQKAPGKAAEKAAGAQKASGKAAEKAPGAQKAPGKTAEEAPGKTVEKASEKASGKTVEKVSENPAEKEG